MRIDHQAPILLRSIMLWTLSVVAITAQGQESDSAKEFATLADRIANEYTITAGGKELQLRQEAVLNWTNPVVGEIYGAVFVWTEDSRPQAIASMYKWYRPHTHSSHEFQSLTEAPITCTRKGQKEWRTTKPGVSWKRIPDAPPAGRTPTQRLVQMRGLAKKFDFEMTEKGDSITRLRLLSQPLLRYESLSENIIDGTLFALAKATDPESLLMIEARKQDDEVIWYYAIARSNFLGMRAELNGAEVWNVPKLRSSEIYSASGPYTKFHFK